MNKSIVTLLLAASLYAAAPTMSMKTYETITKVQEMMEAQRYTEAAKMLDEHLVKSEKLPFDQAYMYNIYGYLYIAQGSYSKALVVFEKALALQMLDEAMTQNLLYNLAQLYLQEGDYARAIARFERWMEHAKVVSPEQRMLYVSALVQSKAFEKALGVVKQVIAQSPKPVALHYQTRFYLEYELGRLNDAIKTLHGMIELFEPNKTYYAQLAGLYAMQERYSEVLGVMELMRAQKMEFSEAETLQYARLLLSQDQPYRASKVLDEALRTQKLPRSTEHLKLTAEAFLSAREYLSAIAYYEELAALEGEKGEHYGVIANLYARKHQYDKVVQTVDKALKQGRAGKGDLLMLQGFAYFELNETLKAKAVFDEAKKDPKHAKAASQWIEFLTGS
ncbi:MAG: tetratricopeptide repeat protein [Campylobacterales bacterium]|nr:tetratricopeptide repeat protein [Campylobacterales bacterium]